MTKEEAIEQLCIIYLGEFDKDREAKDMAISALMGGNTEEIEKAETKAYFDGQAYGWEQGRKALIDDVKAEIKGWYWQADKQALAKDPCVVDAMVDLFIRTIDNIGKADMRGEENEMSDMRN
jgi:hypothetical protein